MTASPFAITFQSEPFTSAYDPVVFHADHFGDGLHRVLTMVPDTAWRLHTTADFQTFTLEVADWHPEVTKNGANTFQDGLVLPDGTFVLYQNDGTESATAVWAGTAADIDAGTMTRQGRVLSTEGDCGVFYDAATDTVHIFSENADNPFGSVSSSALSHWTTPGDDLLTATQHANAINTGGTWGTGDPCVVEAFDAYWMFTDYTEDHPTYWIALYRSDDLYTWELVDPKVTQPSGVHAGDFDLVDMGDHFIALSEYTGGNAGVGVWRIDKRATRSFRPVAAQVGGARRSVTVGGERRAVSAWTY